MFVTTWDQLINGITTIKGPIDLAIGFFDGVHRGHQKILNTLIRQDLSRMIRQSPNRRVVLSFLHHPRIVLTGKEPDMLTTLNQRKHRLSDMGITDLVLIDFSRQFSLLSGEDFIKKLLEALVLQTMVVGSEFRCGRNRDTDVAALERILSPAGTRLVTVTPLIMGTKPVSSTRIRNAVRQGDLALAQAMIGTPYEVDLSRGYSSKESAPSTRKGSGCLMSIATESLGQILPKPGLYAVSLVTVDGRSLETVAEVTRERVSWTVETSRTLSGLRFYQCLETSGDEESH